MSCTTATAKRRRRQAKLDERFRPKKGTLNQATAKPIGKKGK